MESLFGIVTRMIRTVRILLLVLIVIGVGLLCTQNLWVSHVVSFLLKYEPSQTIVQPSPEAQKLQQTGSMEDQYVGHDSSSGDDVIPEAGSPQ